jgi:multidrug efflux pump
MTLPELCIRRPVFATVLSLVIVLVGLVCFQRLGVRQFPAIDPPVVTVETHYPGASASIIETQVTEVLENSLAGIEGVDYMSSSSREEVSQITLTFLLSRDPGDATSDVRDRVSRVRGALPREVLDPVVQKTEADARPVMWIAIYSDTQAPLALTDYAERYIKDRLAALPGVAYVRVFGAHYSMRLWLDPERLAAYGMTPQDVEDALTRQNVEIPAGRIESRQREFTVTSESDLRTEEQFNNLILRDSGGFLVRLKDVGHAKLGPDNSRFKTRYNGHDCTGLGIIKQATANPLEIAKAARAEMAKVAEGLPSDVHFEIPYDQSLFIRASIDNVYEAISEAVVLVVLIIFFFLRTFRATIIPLVTIPVSLIGACIFMVALGFTINTLTLLAAVLAIGLVVDDAIVMLENVFRHIEAGEPPMQAALKGAREIAFAIIAMTLTLAAVYAPVGFQPGTTGKLFTEFAWTLAGAVLVSGFVALTLTPMMCSKLLVRQEKHGRVYNWIEDFINGITQGYHRLLRSLLEYKLVVLAVGAVVAATGIFLGTQLKRELAPTEDQGLFIGMFQAPEGATLEYTDGYARRLEKIYASVPEINRYFVAVGFPVDVTSGLSFVRVTDWKDRERSIFDITKELQPRMFAGIPGVMAFPITPAAFGVNFLGKPVSVMVLTTDSFESLAAMMEKLVKRVSETPGMQNVEADLKLNKPQLRVEINRDKAAAMGVSPLVVGRALETLLGGRQVTRFKREGQQYDVLVQLQDIDRTNPNDLNRIYVRSQDGHMAGLANLINLRETVAPRDLPHFNQLRAAQISANLAPDSGLATGDGLRIIEQAVHEELPGTVQLDYSGQAREFKTASSGMVFIFSLALIFIFLVLAAQFESFLSPFIIMLTVPLSMAGALSALWLLDLFFHLGWAESGGSNNIYSQVGLVTLIGLITKHGILIVEFGNQLQLSGREKRAAIVEAATLRLRPILMTTGAMVLGAVPLALADGAGAESRKQIGVAIVGGLLVGTLFTLFVIPAVYDLLAGKPRHSEDEEREPVPVK